MYEELNDFEKALSHFGTRVEIITAMEMANKLSTEDAYQMIKAEMKEMKKFAGSIKMNSENAAVSDSLKVSQNEDGSFTLEWDKEDPHGTSSIT